MTGWGSTSEGGSISSTLKTVDVPHVPDSGMHNSLDQINAYNTEDELQSAMTTTLHMVASAPLT